MEKLIDGKLCEMAESDDPCAKCCFWKEDTCTTKDRDCLTEENENKYWRLKDVRKEKV